MPAHPSTNQAQRRVTSLPVIRRGVATGEVYRYIYPQNQSTLNFYVVTGGFFSLTQDKFDIVPVCALAPVSFTYLHTTIIRPQMKFLATPLLTRLIVE